MGGGNWTLGQNLGFSRDTLIGVYGQDQSGGVHDVDGRWAMIEFVLRMISREALSRQTALSFRIELHILVLKFNASR